MDFELNLDSETVEEAHPGEPLTVSPSTSLREVFGLLKEHDRGNVIVCDEARQLVGIFTERDALQLMANRADLDVPISSVMSENPVTLAPTATVGKAIRLMARGGYRRLPVVSGPGQCSGVLKVSGILHYLVEHFPSVIYNLPPEPHHSTQSREGA